MLSKLLELGRPEGLDKLMTILDEADPCVALVPFKTISKRYEICDGPLPSACVSCLMLMDIPSEFLEGVRATLEASIVACINKEGAGRPLVIHYPIPDNNTKYMY
jgi:hypothetical protein